MGAVQKKNVETSFRAISDKDFAEYCSSMIEEMRGLADERGLNQFSQILSVAVFEGKRIARYGKG